VGLFGSGDSGQFLTGVWSVGSGRISENGPMDNSGPNMIHLYGLELMDTIKL
jgi:hypothetical protein